MEEGGDRGLWFSQAEPGLEGDKKQNPVLNEPHGLFYAQSCLLSWADIPGGWRLAFLPHGSQHNLYKHLVVWANVPLFAILSAVDDKNWTSRFYWRSKLPGPADVPINESRASGSEDASLFFKQYSQTETKIKARGSELLTLGACGVFGFWKNLVISAFSALMRCNAKMRVRNRELKHAKAPVTEFQSFLHWKHYFNVSSPNPQMGTRQLRRLELLLWAEGPEETAGWARLGQLPSRPSYRSVSPAHPSPPQGGHAIPSSNQAEAPLLKHTGRCAI